MSIASEPKRCPKCGGTIPAEAPQGLCPKCLLLQASVPTEVGTGAPAKSAPPTHDELAAAFPQLEILELIGQGGMGFVFKARQPHLDRFVALKILPQSLAADPAFAERFTREGRVLARLNHPNIVTIHDFGQANGFFYLLMEFVEGVNLRQAMRVGRFTPAQALGIVPKICEALQFAHNEGILHRDIKPENILLDAKGRVKIADFGIAKLVGVAEVPERGPGGTEPIAPATLTEAGKTLGTPHYMAPEQIEHPQDVDQRADIYSLGVVFYEMLTGELPLGRFAPPSEKSAVDERTDEIVLRALQKERERRQHSAGELKTQVETITRGEAPPRAEPVSTQPLRREEAEPRRARLATVAVVSLALVLGLAFGVWYLAGHTAAPARKAAAAGPVTKTLVLTRATNQWVGTTKEVQTAGVWTDAHVNPGESLLALVKRPDGSLAQASSLLFIQSAPNGMATSTSFSWFFGGAMGQGFGESEAQAAVSQFSASWIDKPLTLVAGEPLELFTVTNHSGGVMAGYVKFMRSVPKPVQSVSGSVVKPQAIVRVRGYAAYIPSLNYSVTLPPGYSLWATANIGQATTHLPQGANPGDYHTAWFQPPSVPTNYRDRRARLEARCAALERQFKALLDRGPIPVVLGEPCQVFAVTNNSGELYRGFLELAAPGSDGTTNNEPQSDSARIAPPGAASEVTGASNLTSGTAHAPAVPPAQVESSPVPTETLRAPGLPVHRLRLPGSASRGSAPATPAGSPQNGQIDPATGLPVGSSGKAKLDSTTGLPVAPAGSANGRIDPATGLPANPAGNLSGGIDPATGLPATVGTNAGPAFREPYAGLNEAREFAAKGSYNEALECYLNCYHETRSSSSAPPLVSLLPDWVELGRKYPKARQALVAIQKADQQEFIEGRGYSDLFRELVQINDALQEGDAIYALFKSLYQADPTLAKQCYTFAEELLLRRGEYELCLSCVGQVQRRYETLVGTHQMQQDTAKRMAESHQQSQKRLADLRQQHGWPAPSFVPVDSAETMKKSADNFFVGQVCRWIEILVGTGRKADAEKLRDQALTVLDDPRLKSAVNDAQERVKAALASPQPAPPQSASLTPTVRGPAPVGTNLLQPSASVERWSPLPVPGQKPDLSSILAEAKDLAAAGKCEEALQRHLWYHNHALEYEPSQRGVRISFALTDWVELGRRYPKASQALLEIRDIDTHELVAGSGSFDQFQSVAAINHEYGNEDATSALFKTVYERNAVLGKKCYDVVERLLVQKGQYALCLSCLGDYEARFGKIRQDWERGRKWEDNMARTRQEGNKKMAEYWAKQGRQSPAMTLPEPPRFYDNHFVEQTRDLIQILVGAGHTAEAGKIQEQAVAALDDPRLKSAFTDAEKRVRD